jgi:hypothetical protein
MPWGIIYIDVILIFLYFYILLIKRFEKMGKIIKFIQESWPYFFIAISIIIFIVMGTSN